MTDEKMPDEVGIDNDYPDTGDNRFSLKIKEHRTRYIRADIHSAELEKVRELIDHAERNAGYTVSSIQVARAILDKITGDKIAEAELIERMHRS
jgi:hypothetical protein